MAEAIQQKLKAELEKFSQVQKGKVPASCSCAMLLPNRAAVS